MNNFGLLRQVIEKTINGQTFIRTSNQDTNGDVINTHMYQVIKTDNGDLYKEVFPQSLPYDITNKLSVTNSYKPVDEIKSERFTKTLKALKDKILNVNKFEGHEFLDIDYICDLFYVLAKAPNMNFYSLSSLIPNEFGVVQNELPVLAKELPYVIMNILEKEDFKERTILVYNNIFARIVKKEDKYNVLIYELIQSKNNNDEMRLNTFYTIFKEENNYVLVYDTESKHFSKLNNSDIAEITKEFIESIGLSIVTN